MNNEAVQQRTFANALIIMQDDDVAAINQGVKTQGRHIIDCSRRIKSGMDHPYWRIGDILKHEGISLKIVGIRFQRLHDISEADAISEGVEVIGFEGLIGFGGTMLYKDYLNTGHGCWSAKDSFRTRWQARYGIKSWDSNKWVWVIEFERLNNRERVEK